MREEIGQRRLRLLELEHVREVARAFDGEEEVVGRVGAPLLEAARARQAVEGAVDLDGGEVRRHEGELALARQADRIEAAVPVRIDPAARADEDAPASHGFRCSKRCARRGRLMKDLARFSDDGVGEVDAERGGGRRVERERARARRRRGHRHARAVGAAGDAEREARGAASDVARVGRRARRARPRRSISSSLPRSATLPLHFAAALAGHAAAIHTASTLRRQLVDGASTCAASTARAVSVRPSAAAALAASAAMRRRALVVDERDALAVVAELLPLRELGVGRHLERDAGDAACPAAPRRRAPSRRRSGLSARDGARQRRARARRRRG